MSECASYTVCPLSFVNTYIPIGYECVWAIWCCPFQLRWQVVDFWQLRLIFAAIFSQVTRATIRDLPKRLYTLIRPWMFVYGMTECLISTRELICAMHSIHIFDTLSLSDVFVCTQFINSITYLWTRKSVSVWFSTQVRLFKFLFAFFFLFRKVVYVAKILT